jgi:hypothetical protein
MKKLQGFFKVPFQYQIMYRELGKVWNSAKLLFDYKKINKTFEEALPNADFRIGLVAFILAGFIGSAVAAISKFEEVHFGIYTYNTFSEVAEIGTVALDTEPIIKFAMLQLLIAFPFGVIFHLGYERVIYQIFKMVGGKATFAQHYYVSAIMAMAFAMVSFLGLLAPLPCLGVTAVVAIIILTLYFILYVNARAYEIAHKIPFAYALIAILVFLIPRLLIITFVMTFAGNALGIPEYYEINGA